MVESWITHAERLVNKLKGTTFSGTIPDDVKMGTLEIAKRISTNQMIEDGAFEANNKSTPERKPLIDDDVFAMINVVDENFFGKAYARSDADT